MDKWPVKREKPKVATKQSMYYYLWMSIKYMIFILNLSFIRSISFSSFFFVFSSRFRRLAVTEKNYYWMKHFKIHIGLNISSSDCHSPFTNRERRKTQADKDLKTNKKSLSQVVTTFWISESLWFFFLQFFSPIYFSLFIFVVFIVIIIISRLLRSSTKHLFPYLVDEKPRENLSKLNLPQFQSGAFYILFSWNLSQFCCCWYSSVV